MPPEFRRIFPWLMLSICGSAVIWALSFSSIEPADFSFQNGDDVKTLDPGRATGQPEHQVLDALFEGLLRQMPDGPIDENGLQPVVVAPGMANLPEISADGRTYTFQIRDGMQWSNGSPVTAHDFVWSWQRVLHPDTASEYAEQLYFVKGGKQYNTADVQIGDRVEAELKDRPSLPDPSQPFPRGTVVSGILTSIEKPPRPASASGSEALSDSELADWQERWIYHIDVKPVIDGGIDWNTAGTTRRFARNIDAIRGDGSEIADVTPVHHVLIDFDEYGGVSAIDDLTLVVQLNEPTPFFSFLTGFYTLYPVNRVCVERFGSPAWTKPENIVTNGPYLLEFRRIRDRIRLLKNERYWDAANVDLNRIDAYAVSSRTTALNMYLKGQIDWAFDLPQSVMEEVQKFDEARIGVALTVYFYRLNTSQKPLDDSRVRRALNLAIDKRQIVTEVTRAGEVPAQSVVPPYLPDYVSPPGEAFNPTLARELLAEAGYPDGRGMPTLTILYNTSESHRAVAEVIQQHWQNNLNVKAALENMEWGTYLDRIYTEDYSIARGGWISDYPDANTFLEIWTTGNSHNSTGWSSAVYDDLIHRSQAATGQARLDLLNEAETLLLENMPCIPLYFYTRTNLVRDEFEGFHANVMDIHPLHHIRRKD